MTKELLTSIVSKNQMYVEWKTTPVTSADHEKLKLQFKNYEKEVRNAIQETKQGYLIEYSRHINATLKNMDNY